MPRPATGRLDGEEKSLAASEWDEGARAAWRETAATIAAARFVFVDESGTHTQMTPLCACAPRNHTRNTTLVAALTLGGIQDSMAVEGAMDTAAFVAWLEQGLGPTLAQGQIVVLDNLNVHKGERVREIIEGYGCRLLFLPAYSPDLNPIEGTFSKVKQALRRAGKRTQGELIAAIGAALETVTAQDAAGWFAHCGYPPTQDQSL